MAMIKLQLTFEVNVYDGRIEPPYDSESNWDLWFYDNFIRSCLNSDDLRPGEYIKVLECIELSEES
jgi:hypothetical protein